MPYAIYAAPIPVPPEHRGTMLGMRYNSEQEALARAAELRRSGWFVYRVTGPGGFEATEQAIEQLAQSPPP